MLSKIIYAKSIKIKQWKKSIYIYGKYSMFHQLCYPYS
uniref:Uncharacterized protein n=1 Tax=Anguilla anguilla TaxID=7936 RepID=A0A0E9PV56_ANGAN